MKRSQLLASFPFWENSRWKGAVEVLRRQAQGGTFIDLRLRFGKRYVPLPRRQSLQPLLDALVKGQAYTQEAYTKLIEELNR